MSAPGGPAPHPRAPDRPLAVFVGGPPASGKTTLAAALARALHAALIDLDTATGPLTALVLELLGAGDLDEQRAARMTRRPRYETVLGLAEDSLRAGTSAVVVAPLTAERDAEVWSQLTGRLAPLAEVRLVWLVVGREELAARLRARAAVRDVRKLADPLAYAAGLDLSEPGPPHLALDAPGGPWPTSFRPS